MKVSVVLARVLTPATLFLSLLVVGELALAWRDMEAGVGVAYDSSRTTPTEGQPDSATPEDPLTRILARPLFTPGRHGATNSPVTASAPAQKPSEPPRLLGLLISGSKRFAWLEDAEAETPTMVSEGDDIGDFTVESIGQRSLVLSDAKGEDHEVFPSTLTGPTGTANPQQARVPAAGAPDEQKDDDEKDDDEEPTPAAGTKP